MILSDKDLKRLISQKELIVRNESLKQNIRTSDIQPGSIDFHLGDEFSVLESKKSLISLNNELLDEDYITTKSNSFILKPLSFCLATTQEYIELPNNISAFVEGRSSVGRLGLFIQNAGWVDAGFKGQITLELFNATLHPIELVEGFRVGQFVFCKMTSDCERPYDGKYQGQIGVVGSRIYEDKEFRNEF